MTKQNIVAGMDRHSKKYRRFWAAYGRKAYDGTPTWETIYYGDRLLAKHRRAVALFNADNQLQTFLKECTDESRANK